MASWSSSKPLLYSRQGAAEAPSQPTNRHMQHPRTACFPRSRDQDTGRPTSDPLRPSRASVELGLHPHRAVGNPLLSSGTT